MDTDTACGHGKTQTRTRPADMERHRHGHGLQTRPADVDTDTACGHGHGPRTRNDTDTACGHGHGLRTWPVDMDTGTACRHGHGPRAQLGQAPGRKHSRGFASPGCVLCAGPEPRLHQGLQSLVLLSHAHSQECSLVPGLRGPRGRDGGLVWECSAGHTFSWEPTVRPASPRASTESTQAPAPRPEARRRGKLAGLGSEQERTQEAKLPGGAAPPAEPVPSPGEEQDEDDEDEKEMLSDASPWTYSSSPDEPVGVVGQERGGVGLVTWSWACGAVLWQEGSRPTPGSPFSSEPDVGRPSRAPAGSPAEAAPTAPAPEALPTPLAGCSSPALAAGSGVDLSRTPLAAQQTEPLASPGSRVRSAPAPARDEDAAQIGPKRIRKAARRELMPCDFAGCGRIFSNRQYLNHHKKYQHLHQKSFCCPEPACGKSFNFKKHLKEHVKLHSDTRDYICEFCARSFRTSSNLVIHRRIHTGEKPLQCEICGFACRQKASLNWHRRKHAETAATLRFPCDFCGKRFEKPDSVAAHCSKSHPARLPAAPEEACPGVSAPESLGSSSEPGRQPPGTKKV
ncbi:PREDICTED: zinc finger protein 692 [Dipodomys ordii]|uniref:Zinc finger protein 692 n=1 Tax=Dipodomys ordii TaxID=10020 RepID=A0A1S3F595_DIPOR|nr:PREDICTED: zinc finger protein 692 [Dipodomys ordii]